MIICKIYKGQGLGNQLWCMKTAYALSLKKNFECSFIDQSNSFLGHEIFNISKKFFKKNVKIKYQYYEKGFFDIHTKCNLYSFDEDILKIEPSTEIIGNFQSEKYFFNKQNEIKSFFLLNEKTIKLSDQFSKYNVLNIRGGEYKRHTELLLPDSYWNHALLQLRHKSDLPFVIVTDDYRYAKKLFPKLEIISNNIQLCFAAIMGCKNIVLSNSSFSYFPIFYGSKKNIIYAPYQWARFNNPMNIWVSPCNYYKNWKWINFSGQIVKNKDCEKNILNTINYLQKYDNKIYFTLPKKEINTLKFFKTIIKKIFGYFNWRFR